MSLTPTTRTVRMLRAVRSGALLVAAGAVGVALAADEAAHTVRTVRGRRIRPLT